LIKAVSAKLGYLVSRYPAVSHTFILREIAELRRLGFCIDVASINGLDRPEQLLTEEERREAAGTFYVKGAGAAGALKANASALLRDPAGYLKGMWFALRLGGFNVRAAGLCFFYFVEAGMVGEWMRTRGLRHLHVHFATPAATVGMIAAKVFGFTLSISVHGPDEFYDVPGYLLAKKIEASQFLCVIGTFARSQLMRISDPATWSKIQVAPLGVDPELFAPRPFLVSPDVFEVLCVGRLVPAKGQHILIAAVDRLRAQGKHVCLRLVGDGPDRPSLELAVKQRGLENQVVFEGAVNQDRIRDLYAKADVFCLASFAEGIPVVLMEAMAMEIPCVSTYITGIPELIRDSIDGLLVAPSDEQSLADAIRRLMEDPNLRRKLGQAGRVRVMEKYNLRKNVGKLADIFDAQLGGKRLEDAA
jgi:colanic acid/amylovoran biosynthesis glycosyltransferase